MPGQWIAGGETPSWKGRNHRCHHPIRRGDRLYVSYWYGGGVILDISDMSKPRTIPGSMEPAVRLADAQSGADRCADRRAISGCWWRMSMCQPLDPKLSPELPAMVWMVNITDETNPIPVSTFQLPELVGVTRR